MTEVSNRYSDRVDPRRRVRAGQASAAPTSAPESMSTSARASLDQAQRAPERRRRVTADELDQIAVSLSDRDRAVVSSIGQYGFLTTAQVEILHFSELNSDQSSSRTCRRVLARLRSQQLIEAAEHRIGGIRAGSSSIVWRLASAGDRLLRRQQPDAPKARRKEPSLRFLQHRLSVADAVCDLTLAARATLFELLRVDNEPATWRPFSGLHGGREVLKPDLFVVTASGDFEDHWFVEIDRGTESVPTVLKQCDSYERYRRSGREQADNGLFPRVLWLVPDTSRVIRLRRAFRHNAKLDEDLFRVLVQQDLVTTISQAGAEGGVASGSAARGQS